MGKPLHRECTIVYFHLNGGWGLPKFKPCSPPSIAAKQNAGYEL